MDITALHYLIICVLIMIVGFFITLGIDRYNYNKKLNSCGHYLPLSMIPDPSRIIHYCHDSMDNILYKRGDIFILIDYVYKPEKMKSDLRVRYYIALTDGGEKVELAPAQIDRLETLYNMKIKDNIFK